MSMVSGCFPAATMAGKCWFLKAPDALKMRSEKSPIPLQPHILWPVESWNLKEPNILLIYWKVWNEAGSTLRRYAVASLPIGSSLSKSTGGL